MNYSKIKIFLIISLFSLMGCDSFLEVEVPTSQLTGNVVFEDKATANAAMIAVFSKLRDNGLLAGGLGSSISLGRYADELISYGLNESSTFLFNNTLQSTTSIVSQHWKESYHQIYSANAVIEGCQNSTTLSTVDKNQLIGEASFVRALIHFYLMNLYGDLPYITTTNYQLNQIVSRMPITEVYSHIITDLNQALALLPEKYLSTDRVRPNRSTVNALLARVYLYKGDWVNASNYASAVLNNSAFIWENDINKVFLKESTSTIWQFNPKLAGNNTDEASTFIFTGSPTSTSLSLALVNSFEVGDLRRANWIKTITSGSGTWYHANKYKIKTNTGTSVEYSIVFRLAEQYLIRAEARARLGELIGAREDLNKVRLTAGLSGTTAVTADEIIAAIMQERRLELFTEFGHRFFDLKRSGQLDPILTVVKPGWNTTDQHWPIPETELLTNKYLTQNPGY